MDTENTDCQEQHQEFNGDDLLLLIANVSEKAAAKIGVFLEEMVTNNPVPVSAPLDERAGDILGLSMVTFTHTAESIKFILEQKAGK